MPRDAGAGEAPRAASAHRLLARRARLRARVRGGGADLVYNATPWQWHVPVCLAAMRHGKHAATEVPAARTIEECWELVETSEKSGRHCSMMENVNYYPDELTILSMVRRGV